MRLEVFLVRGVWLVSVWCLFGKIIVLFDCSICIVRFKDAVIPPHPMPVSTISIGIMGKS